MKFSKEVKLGIAVAASIALLIYGINFLKGINLFQKSNLYYVAFQDITGLSESNPVYANGYRIGIVRTIEYDYDHPGNVYVGMEIEDDMRISEGSYAELETQMLGGVTMNIVLGNSPRMLHPGDTIKGGPKVGALDKVGELVPEFQAMMPKLDSILTSVNTLLSDPALRQTLQNTAQLTSELQTTTRTLNTLMEGDVSHIAKNLEPTTRNLASLTQKLDEIDYAGTMSSINTTLTGLQTTTSTLNQAVSTTMASLDSDQSSIGLLLKDRTLYDNLNRNLVSSDSLLNDLRLHPKRYVHFSIFGKKDKAPLGR